MGSRGPVPKRDAVKAGHRAKSEAAERIARRTPVGVPPPRQTWHPSAIEFYLSLPESGQAENYEPSDWQTALLLGDLLSAMHTAMDGGTMPSGQTIAALQRLMDSLLVSEASRRRAHVEVDRPKKAHDADAAATPRSAIAQRFEKLAAVD